MGNGQWAMGNGQWANGRENSAGTSRGEGISIFADGVSGLPQAEREPASLDNAGSQPDVAREGR